MREIEMLIAMGLARTPERDLPLADCKNCEYGALNASGGHCYMFKEKPEGDRCGQMRRVKP